jgi:2-methylcitrate dehydratase PrpD
MPPEVIDRAKGVTLQAIASALLGYSTAGGQAAVGLVTEEESVERNGASVMVTGAKVTKGAAGFANAEMAYAGGKWDTFRMLMHCGVTIIPTALVAAETTPGVSGRDFLTGVAAGYEVMERMAADFVAQLMSRGFHPSPVFGIFGAAVAAGKIMGFSEDQVNELIGLCVNLAGGNVESRTLREGPAARNALLAVLLAKQGHRGGETALEGNAGFYTAYAGNNLGQLTYSFTGETEANLPKITANLGKDWMFLETLYRIYSIPGFNIAHVDVTAKLCEEHNIRYEDVDRIEAVVNWFETQYPSPAFAPPPVPGAAVTRGAQQYYTAYGVVKRGFPMLTGTPDPPEVLDLMKRVTIIPSHTMTLFGPKITIFTKEGKIYTKQSTGREFIWNFAEEARRIRAVIPGLPIPPAQFEEIIATVRDLDGQGQPARLVQLTVKKV